MEEKEIVKAKLLAYTNYRLEQIEKILSIY